MDAEFLNKNIEESFSEDLYYINLKEVLSSEIEAWNEQYSVLKERLRHLDLNLKVKIQEKEELRNYNKLLDGLEEKIIKIHEDFNKKIKDFRSFLRETLKDGYSNDKFTLVMERFERIRDSLKKLDEKIYNISQKITKKEDDIIKRHKEVIGYWINVKEELNEIFEYYLDGFTYFNTKLNEIESLREKISKSLSEVHAVTKERLEKNKFQEAFEIITEKSDDLLDKQNEEVENIKEEIDQAQAKIVSAIQDLTRAIRWDGGAPCRWNRFRSEVLTG